MVLKGTSLVWNDIVWAELDALGRFGQVETGLSWTEPNTARIEQA